MVFLPFAIFAYFLNAVAVLTDKFLLSRSIPNPLLYVFNISFISLVVFVMVPFTHFPSGEAFYFGSTSTLLWTLGAYFMFSALKIGQASRVIPVIGTLIPIILAGISAYSGEFSLNEIWAVLFLVLGLFFLITPYLKGKVVSKEVALELVSALFFANSYVFLKWAYMNDDFLSVMVYSRTVIIPVIVIILIIPYLRRLVLTASNKGGYKFSYFSKTGMLFILGQTAGGFSGLLLNYSISLANPAVVNSLQGTQYIFIFFASLILMRFFPHTFKEKLGFGNILGKVIGILLIAFGLYMLAFGEAVTTLKLGITFSPRYARALGLEPRLALPKLLDDLNVKAVRLPVYWDEVEKIPGQYNFSEIDYYLTLLRARNIEAVLVLGHKQPRWPECFAPDWTLNLSRVGKDKAILSLVREEVSHFKKFSNIKAWQVENEPLFSFGVCDRPTKQTYIRLQEEVDLVKNNDDRPVIVTDSGELSSWINARKLGDILGVTMYRSVWNPYFGMGDYPLPPVFYSLKAELVKFITSKNHSPVIIAELQAEPWVPAAKSVTEISFEENTKYFPAEKLSKNFDFAKKTRFPEIYFWGAEWWYWMEKNGYPEYMIEAKKIFNSQ